VVAGKPRSSGLGASVNATGAVDLSGRMSSDPVARGQERQWAALICALGRQAAAVVDPLDGDGRLGRAVGTGRSHAESPSHGVVPVRQIRHEAAALGVAANDPAAVLVCQRLHEGLGRLAEPHATGWDTSWRAWGTKSRSGR
jgi:hypothetical protein